MNIKTKFKTPLEEGVGDHLLHLRVDNTGCKNTHHQRKNTWKTGLHQK